MSAGEWAAAVGTVAMIVVVLGLLFVLTSLSRTLAALRTSLEQFSRESTALAADLQSTVRRADAELERVDNLLATAESVGGTVDAASRLAYLTFSNPVVKALAFSTGVARAGRRLRRKD
jgi:uncharacterized protein YoxC